MIGSLNFLNNFTLPEAQFVVHECTRFDVDTHIYPDFSTKWVIEYLKGTHMQGLIMNITGYIWASWLQTEIELNTMEAKYIVLSQAIRDIFPLTRPMKEFGLVLELKIDIPKFLWINFENTVTVHKDNQGKIALAFAPQMWPRTKNITIKYHHLQIFVVKCDIVTNHINMKEQATDIFMKPLGTNFYLSTPKS